MPWNIVSLDTNETFPVSLLVSIRCQVLKLMISAKVEGNTKCKWIPSSLSDHTSLVISSIFEQTVHQTVSNEQPYVSIFLLIGDS